MQLLSQRRQCRYRRRHVIVPSQILRLQEMGMLGDQKGSCLAGDSLWDTATLWRVSSESVTRSPGAMLLGDVSHCVDCTPLDRPDIGPLEGVHEANMVRGMSAVSKDPCQWWPLRRGAKSVRQPCLQVLDHPWQWRGGLARARIDLIRQGPLRVGLTQQRLAHWAYMRATLCVCAAVGDGAAAMVLAHRRQVHGCPRHHVGDHGLPDGAGQGRVEATPVVPQALRRPGGLGGVGNRPSQGGVGKPVTQRAGALGMDGAGEGRQGQGLPGAHPLRALGTVPIDVGDDVGPLTCRPPSRGEADAEDFGALGAQPSSLDGVEAVVEVAQGFLPQASRVAVDPAPLRVVVIDVPFEAFLFQALPLMGSSPPRMVVRRSMRGYLYHKRPS